MRRRNFLRTCLGATLMTMGCETQMEMVQERESDEAVIKEAKERIEKHRKGDVTIAVHRPDKKPVANAKVTLTQKRHEFLFGCNIFRWGNIPDPKSEEAYRERFAALLNYATLGFYWAWYERQKGKPIYDYTDKVVEWCLWQNITCKGHPLVWDNQSSSPDHWLPDDLAEIERLSTGRVREIVSRFAGRIDIFDVVNEPTDLTRFPTKMNKWARSLGAVPFTALHLKVARSANPKAILLVNDYRTDKAFLHILQQLKDDEGRFLFDVVGIQSHMHGGVWPPSLTWQVCERFAQLGLPLHFTETTIVSGPGRWEQWGETTPEGEEKQAEATVKFYTVLFSHPAVQAITWWDFSDDGAWQGAPAGWLRKDMSQKPVYEQLMALIKGEWWTKASGVTNAKGEWRTRATFGDYELTIRTPDRRTVIKSLSVQRGKDNHFTIALP